LFRSLLAWINRSWLTKLATLAAVAGIITIGFAIKVIFYPGLPAPVKVYDIVRTNKVWTEDERQLFYHSSQGSQVMPNSWFLALEQPDSKDLFISNDYMSRFRFLPDPNPLRNPSLLPIGFAKDDPDPVTGEENLGLSCALCHTAMVTYKGMGVLVDGAPGRFNFDLFLERLVLAVGVTAAPEVLRAAFDPNKFDRFARRVLAEKYSPKAKEDLRRRVRAWFQEKVNLKRQELSSDAFHNQKTTTSGFGRLDALGTGGNTVYRKLTPNNLRVLNAPVKAFPLWYASDYDWVQSNGSIRQPMARNIIEALAVNAYLALPGGSKTPRFLSSARLRQMYEMETAASRLAAPAWPDSVLGAVDRAKAERGKVLYGQYCSRCHSPQLEPAPLCGDDIAIRNKKRYFMLRLYKFSEIGTDENDAVNFASRTLDASALGLSPDTQGPVVIALAVGGVLRRGIQSLGMTQAKMDEWVGQRADCWRAPKAYPARPLDGAWAAAPYLHNASVPNLYQLLLPAEKRDKVFYTGSTEFDPVHVGYETTMFPGAFKLDVRLPGNSNAGHEFRNSAPPGTKGVLGPEFTDTQRYELIEYLKIIDEMPGARQEAAKEARSFKDKECWTDPYWGVCSAAPLSAPPGTIPTIQK
jgi:cytochrome c5